MCMSVYVFVFFLFNRNWFFVVVDSLGRIVFELGNGGSNTGQELETPQCLLDLMENNDSGKYPLFEDFIADVDAFVEKTIKQNNKTNKACRTMRFNARELQDDVRHYCENAVQTHSKLIQVGGVYGCVWVMFA
eukprot:m.68971 g.68971  ORF g.68971 m.68971 type:complete len:133 (+) comp11621_c3_seq10:2697-3095(+)